MGIYIVFFAILLLGLLPKPMRKSNVYTAVILFLLALIIGLRDVGIGADTKDYVEDFLRYSRMDWNAIIKDSSDFKEPFFQIITGVISRFTDSYTIYLCFWGLINSIVLYYFYKRELKRKIDVAIAIIIVFILCLYSFYSAGMRQTAAMSAVIVSYKYLKQIDLSKFFLLLTDSNFYKFIICLMVAFSLHHTSIIFVFSIFAMIFKVRWWYIFIPITFFFAGNYIDAGQLNLIAQMVFSSGYEQYGTSYESSLSIAGFLIQLMLFLICFIQKDKLVREDKSNNMLLNFALIGLGFQSLTGIIAEMFRLAFYFNMFYMILVPRALFCYKCTFKNSILYWGFIVGALIYIFFLSSGCLFNYKFA